MHYSHHAVQETMFLPKHPTFFGLRSFLFLLGPTKRRTYWLEDDGAARTIRSRRQCGKTSIPCIMGVWNRSVHGCPWLRFLRIEYINLGTRAALRSRAKWSRDWGWICSCARPHNARTHIYQNPPSMPFLTVLICYPSKLLTQK